MTDNSRAAMLAAMMAVSDAAEPLREVMQNPLFPWGEDGRVAVWALNKGFELTAGQVSALGNAHDLFCLALAVPASEAIH